MSEEELTPKEMRRQIKAAQERARERVREASQEQFKAERRANSYKNALLEIYEQADQRVCEGHTTVSVVYIMRACRRWVFK